MNTTTITMEPTQETSAILTTLAEWWKEFLAAGGIGGVIAFLKARKISISKVLKGVYGWLRAAVMLPIRLEGIETRCTELQSQLSMKDGKGLMTWAERVDESLIGVRRTLALETSMRRVAMQGVDRAIFEAAADGGFRWVNDRFLAETGGSIDDVRGENWQNIVALPDREEFTDAWHRQVRAGNNFRGKFRLNTNDGYERWMSFDATCNKDDLGQVLGYLGYLRPIADPRVHQSEA